MIAKDGSLFSETYLAFVRRLPCCLCYKEPPSEAHHHPPNGRGVTRDDKTLPACRECHKRCHGETVVLAGQRLRPVSEKRQGEMVAITRVKFLEHASSEQFAAFAGDRARWLEERGGAEPVPW